MKSLNKNGLIFVVFLSLFAFFASCSEDSNFNKLFVSSSDKNSFNYLYNKASMAYDSKDIDEALSLADRAYQINPDSVGVNILIADIYLYKTGMDAIRIIQKYLNKEKDENSSKFASFLSMFKDLLNITEEDVVRFGEGNKLLVSNVDIFKSFPIIHPKTLTEFRNLEDVSVIDSLTKLKAHICRYIDPSLNNNSCAISFDDSYLTVKQSRQTKLLWAFSHLVEAITIAQAIMYTPPAQSVTTEDGSASKTSLESRAEALKQFHGDGTDEEKKARLTANMDAYLDAVSELTGDIESVFDTQHADSLFLALIQDLVTTSSSLKAILDIGGKEVKDSNYLKKLADKIDKVATASTEQKNDISGDLSDSSKNILALKNKLMDKANSKIKDQVAKLKKEELDTPSGISTAQKNKLCAEYTKLTNSKELPEICQ